MFRFFDAVPYILAIGTIVLGALTIIKEWEEYEKKRWLRIAVLVVFIVVGVLTIVSLRLDEMSKQAEKLKSEGEIHDLTGKVEEAAKSQKDNTGMFLESLGKVSKEVGDLQTEVKTEALQKKLASVQTDLQKTQKALEPGPKAELLFSFFPFDNPPFGSTLPPRAITEITLPVVDGSVHIECTVLNMTEIEAANAEINFNICDACKFAKEPDGLSKLPGMKDTQRYLSLPHMQPLQAQKAISLDVVPPPFAKAIVIGFTYRCTTCDIHKKQSLGTVHLTW